MQKIPIVHLEEGASSPGETLLCHPAARQQLKAFLGLRQFGNFETNPMFSRIMGMSLTHEPVSAIDCLDLFASGRSRMHFLAGLKSGSQYDWVLVAQWAGDIRIAEGRDLGSRYFRPIERGPAGQWTHNATDKGSPVERRVRKATGLNPSGDMIAELPKRVVCGIRNLFPVLSKAEAGFLR